MKFAFEFKKTRLKSNILNSVFKPDLFPFDIMDSEPTWKIEEVTVARSGVSCSSLSVWLKIGFARDALNCLLFLVPWV